MGGGVLMVRIWSVCMSIMARRCERGGEGGRGVLLPQGQPASASSSSASGKNWRGKRKRRRPLWLLVVVGKLGVVWVQKS